MKTTCPICGVGALRQTTFAAPSAAHDQPTVNTVVYYAECSNAACPGRFRRVDKDGETGEWEQVPIRAG